MMLAVVCFKVRQCAGSILDAWICLQAVLCKLPEVVDQYAYLR